MDVLAKSTLLQAMIHDNSASGFFPGENVVVTVEGSKVADGSASYAIGSAMRAVVSNRKYLLQSKTL